MAQLFNNNPWYRAKQLQCDDKSNITLNNLKKQLIQ